MHLLESLERRPLDDLLSIIAHEADILPVRAMEAVLRKGTGALPVVAELVEEEDMEERFLRPAWPVILLALLGRAADEPGPAIDGLKPSVARWAGLDSESAGFWAAVAAADGLAEMGPPAVPALEELSRDEEERVRLLAYAALGFVGTDRAVDRLLEATQDDLELADVVASALREAGRKDAIEPLHRLLGRCPPHRRLEVEEAIRYLHHGVPPPLPPPHPDWRLRYRPSGFLIPWDPGWPGLSAMMREEEELVGESRKAPPIRPLAEILADGPVALPKPEPEACALCEAPGQVRYGLPSCQPAHTARLAALQAALLRRWAEEGVDDLFGVLGRADRDYVRLRYDLRAVTGPLEGGGEHPLDEWVAEAEIVRATGRWFVERGVEELTPALEELERTGWESGVWPLPDPVAGPSADRRPPEDRDDEPPDERRPELVRDRNDARYRRWLSEPQTDLRGLTPQQASELVVGRLALEEILRGFEDVERRRRLRDGVAYDLTWLRKELGLETPESGRG